MDGSSASASSGDQQRAVMMCVETEEEEVTCRETILVMIDDMKSCRDRESVVAVMTDRSGISFEMVCCDPGLLLHNSLIIMITS